MNNCRQVTFEEFMREALHDPGRGYYARNIRAVGGERADFTTVPMRFGGTLAAAVAKWAADAMKKTGCRHLIELGPGEGSLMHAVIRALPWHLRWRTRCHLVETSHILQARQQARLGDRARWHRSPGEAMRACDGRAVVFSNELVDAFPVRVFRKSATTWRELALEMGLGDQVRREIFQDVKILPESSIFQLPHPEDQRVEVHDSYRKWLVEWLPHWKAGEMLTIDYGDVAGNLYHRRPAGSLRGYFMHQRVTGAEIYQNVGMQDLTADVNFTDLSQWSSPWCVSHEPESLASFAREMLGQDVEGEVADEDGLGGAFRVLRQSPRS